MSKLHEIAQQRKADVKTAQTLVSLSTLNEKMKTLDQRFGPPLSLEVRLQENSLIPGARMHIAAEFKRASPSKGAIAEDDMKLEDQVSLYTQANSSLVSILTEPTWFKGTLEDMELAKTVIFSLNPHASRPLVLRKDFIVHEYQLYEARAFGADTVLLIVAILSDDELVHLISTCRKLGMEPLVEAANPVETRRAIDCGARVLGINNRDLTTFKLDLNTTIACAKVVQPGDKVLLLSLSGIKSRQDVLLYEDLDVVRGILVGEHLMKCANPKEAIYDLVVESNNKDRVDEVVPLVKICGMVRPEDALVACHAKVDLIGLIFAEKSPRALSVKEAQQIVQAVWTFRETNGPVVLPRVKRTREENAQQLALACKRGPLIVGVFMDQSLDFVNQMVKEAGLDLVQFHGKETLDMCKQCLVPVIKVVHVPFGEKVSNEEITASCQAFLDEKVVAILLDTTTSKSDLTGGTGLAFDWKIASRYKELGFPVFVAGGLTCDNVQQAIQESGFPFGVDCSSGVQLTAREKNHDLIKTFIRLSKTSV